MKKTIYYIRRRSFFCTCVAELCWKSSQDHWVDYFHFVDWK